tara:strand:- start:7053 stop:7922 length:870 start_codon:yes stop_codon:yes gene_type:complete
MKKLKLNKTNAIDAADGANLLEDSSVDIIVTSPPYWGQRTSDGIGVENDPRAYLQALIDIFKSLKQKLAEDGIVWVNLGDSYNTPINWRRNDYQYSTLGQDKNGLEENNSAYTKKRQKRKQFIDHETSWLKYGNLLALTHRFVVEMVDAGYFYRGEVIWVKKNAMPEGKCRRPHRQHEPIYLFSRSDKHSFSVSPSVKSIWEIAHGGATGIDHCSKFPLDLAKQCISSYGEIITSKLVLDPFAGSGTTGLAANELGFDYIGFEIDPRRAKDANKRLLKDKNKISSIKVA